jgi:hypothetical protein
MAQKHVPTDDIVYDLVSVQYHALNGATLYEKFQQDAHDHEEVRAFFDQCAQQDADRANRCHELIAKITEAPA